MESGFGHFLLISGNTKEDKRKLFLEQDTLEKNIFYPLQLFLNFNRGVFYNNFVLYFGLKRFILFKNFNFQLPKELKQC